ncbi:S1C family serine protease [Ruicaihuangia caeni]|uniref:S1C family serine protease n=1 Tax=Ruicaihuangia caeni TaxID=3042517 RepID=UPI00338F3EF8
MTEPTENQHPGQASGGDDRERAVPSEPGATDAGGRPEPFDAGSQRPREAAPDTMNSAPMSSAPQTPQSDAPRTSEVPPAAPGSSGPQPAESAPYLGGHGPNPIGNAPGAERAQDHAHTGAAFGSSAYAGSQHAHASHAGAQYVAGAHTGAPHPATAHSTGTAASAPATAPRRSAIPIIAALAVGALVGGVSGASVALIADGGDSGTTIVGSQSPGTISINNGNGVAPVSAVAAKAGPSVVTISVGTSQGAGTGSGVVIDDQGHIITNTHVVTLDGASGNPKITVRTWDGRVLDATLVGTDPLSDLAVIKVDGADLPAISFADSSSLNVGDAAIAIGAPLGLANTVTDGIVSALNRSITVASSAAPEQPQQDQPQQPDNPFDFWRFDVPGQEQSSARSTVQLSVLQTDAAINPGNSGGALLNAEGKLIGVNVAIASAGNSQGSAGSIGVGFAIPSNLAKRIAGELIDNGAATHGLLGAMVTQPSGGTLGAEIAENPGQGAANDAGLRKGDVVTYLGDTPITSANDLTAQVRALPAGAKTTITYVRDGKVHTADVTLGSLK